MWDSNYRGEKNGQKLMRRERDREKERKKGGGEVKGGGGGRRNIGKERGSKRREKEKRRGYGHVLFTSFIVIFCPHLDCSWKKERKNLYLSEFEAHYRNVDLHKLHATVHGFIPASPLLLHCFLLSLSLSLSLYIYLYLPLLLFPSLLPLHLLFLCIERSRSYFPLLFLPEAVLYFLIISLAPSSSLPLSVLF